MMSFTMLSMQISHPDCIAPALSDAGGDSDKQALINCYQQDLDIADGFTHVRLSLTVGTASSDAAGLVVGVDARYKPGTQDAAVAETVS